MRTFRKIFDDGCTSNIFLEKIAFVGVLKEFGEHPICGVKFLGWRVGPLSQFDKRTQISCATCGVNCAGTFVKFDQYETLAQATDAVSTFLQS